MPRLLYLGITHGFHITESASPAAKVRRTWPHRDNSPVDFGSNTTKDQMAAHSEPQPREDDKDRDMDKPARGTNTKHHQAPTTSRRGPHADHATSGRSANDQDQIHENAEHHHANGLARLRANGLARLHGQTQARTTPQAR